MPVPLFSISLIVVGKVKDRMISEKINDFVTRISFDANCTIHEIKDSDKENEGKKLIEMLKDPGACNIAMSEDGREYTSEGFAHFLQKNSRKLNFIIGGPNGLSDHVKKNVHEIISLSRMTFPHEIARMLLVEQIYRAISIIKNRSYHK
jgi:23S rRNA (pseudouridine1915-N3)-methyltransferase